MDTRIVSVLFNLCFVCLSTSALAGTGQGLLGKYYAHVAISEVSPGVWDAAFSEGFLAFERVDPTIHFYFGDISSPEEYSWSPIDQSLNDPYSPWFDPELWPYISSYGNEYYGVKWTGFIVIPSSGWYQFATVADDGSKVFIDNSLVLNVGRNWFLPWSTGPIELAAGFHKIDVHYWEMTRWDGIRLEWDGGTDGFEWSVVPKVLLYYPEPCPVAADWKNHGQFVKCIAHTVNSLLDAGALTQDEADVIVRGAAQSDIGK